MKAIKLLGNEESTMVEIPAPKPQDSELLIKIESLALCGSCIKLRYKPSANRAMELVNDLGLEYDPQSIPGHEMTGVVVEKGKNTNLNIGDRVFIFPFVANRESPFFKDKKYKYASPLKILGYSSDGGNTEYLAVPEINCYKLPDYVSFEQGAMLLDPVGAPYGAIKYLGGVKQTDTALVLGAGPIGLGAIMILKHLGVENVIVVDKMQTRIDLAKTLGADKCICEKYQDILPIIEELTKGRGADFVLDCVGDKFSIDYAMTYTKPEGKLGVIGEPGNIPNLSVSDQLIHKDLLIAGSWVYDPERLSDLYALIKDGLKIEKIITHRYNLENSVDAWKLFNTYETGKVTISP